MSATVVVGAQWGDEGKGKIVDLLASRAEMVVRYGGGPNAGHTLVVDGARLVLRLVPSGALHPHVRCVLGQGVVVHPATLVEEIDALAGRGVEVSSRLALSTRAHLILPYHMTIDELREAKEGGRIGTTKRGIGPCYEDKVGRRGVRAGDLLDMASARERIAEAVAAWSPTIAALGGTTPEVATLMSELERYAARLVPLLADTAELVDDALSADKAVLFEGAQGTLLDIDHGTYPFVTSSSAIAGGAATGAGVGPTRLGRVLGITKAYTTRVGGGPFPTELTDEVGTRLRDAGGEFGSVTGRPRRTGWLDLVALRYARRVNGLDALAVTKLDVLTGLPKLRVCVAYDTPDGRVESLPRGGVAAATPVYRELEGWDSELRGCRELAALPRAARAYLDFITDAAKVPIAMVSVGPGRDETIVSGDW
jgi:adenylosuccinate synthase